MFLYNYVTDKQPVCCVLMNPNYRFFPISEASMRLHLPLKDPPHSANSQNLRYDHRESGEDAPQYKSHCGLTSHASTSYAFPNKQSFSKLPSSSSLYSSPTLTPTWPAGRDVISPHRNLNPTPRKWLITIIITSSQEHFSSASVLYSQFLLANASQFPKFLLT
jgi:hypothetical protein